MLHTLALNHVYEEHAGNHILDESERRTKTADRNHYDLSRVWEQSLKISSDTKQSTSRPWEQVGVDLFELKKKEYMLTVDKKAIPGKLIASQVPPQKR